MYPCSRSDLHPEAVPDLLTETGHLAGDLQPRQHRPTYIVLMGSWVTEYRQKALTRGGADMAVKAGHDVQHHVAVAAHQQPVGVELGVAGQHRRIDQVHVQDRQAPDLATIAGGCKQILRFSVPMVHGQYMVGQRGGG